jgi:hypothetical protein
VIADAVGDDAILESQLLVDGRFVGGMSKGFK